jgi:hypothetical protein
MKSSTQIAILDKLHVMKWLMSQGTAWHSGKTLL